MLNPGQPQVNENGGGSGATQSSQRCPNGLGGARNTSTYLQVAPTPGAVNVCPPPPEPVNSSIVISQLYGGGGNAGATYQTRLRRAVQPQQRDRWTSGAGRCNTRPRPAADGMPTASLSAARSDPASTYLVSLASGGPDGAPLAARQHQRPDQHERNERQDRARQQLRWARR